MNDQLFQEAADKLAAQLGASEGIERALPYEPTQAPALPLLTVQLDGFQRANLDDEAVVQGRIKDPLGGRTWVINFAVRIWTRLSDAEEAQQTMNKLIARVVTALEDDRSLGEFADASAITSGDTAIVRPREGEPVFVTTCRCAVETTEAL